MGIEGPKCPGDDLVFRHDQVAAQRLAEVLEQLRAIDLLGPGLGVAQHGLKCGSGCIRGARLARLAQRRADTLTRRRDVAFFQEALCLVGRSGPGDGIQVAAGTMQSAKSPFQRNSVRLIRQVGDRLPRRRLVPVAGRRGDAGTLELLKIGGQIHSGQVNFAEILGDGHGTSPPARTTRRLRMSRAMLAAKFAPPSSGSHQTKTSRPSSSSAHCGFHARAPGTPSTGRS